MTAMLIYAFKIIRAIIFSSVKKKKKIPQSSKFSTAKEFFYSHGNFPKPREFPTVKKIFDSQGNFPQPRTFSTIKKFSETKIKGIL